MAKNMTIQIGTGFVINNAEQVTNFVDKIKNSNIEIGIDGVEEAVDTLTELLKKPQILKTEISKGELTEQAKEATAQVNHQFNMLYDGMISGIKKAYSEMTLASKNNDIFGANKHRIELYTLLNMIQDLHRETNGLKDIDIQFDTNKNIIGLDMLKQEISAIKNEIDKTNKSLSGIGETKFFQPAVTHTLRENIKKYNTLKKEIKDVIGEDGSGFNSLNIEEKNNIQNKAEELVKVYETIRALFKKSKVQGFNKKDDEDGIKFNSSGMKKGGTYQKELETILSSVGIGEDIVVGIANEIKSNANVIQDAIVEATKGTKIIDVSKTIVDEKVDEKKSGVELNNNSNKSETEGNKANTNTVKPKLLKQSIKNELKEAIWGYADGYIGKDDFVKIFKEAFDINAEQTQEYYLKILNGYLREYNGDEDTQNKIKNKFDRALNDFTTPSSSQKQNKTEDTHHSSTSSKTDNVSQEEFDAVKKRAEDAEVAQKAAEEAKTKAEADAEAKQKENDELRSAQERSKQDIENLNQRITELESELASKPDSDTSPYDKSYDELQFEIEAKEKMLSEKEGQINQLKTDLAELRSKTTSETTDFNKDDYVSIDEYNALNNKISQVEQGLKNEKAKVEELKQQLKNLENDKSNSAEEHSTSTGKTTYDIFNESYNEAGEIENLNDRKKKLEECLVLYSKLSDEEKKALNGFNADSINNEIKEINTELVKESEAYKHLIELQQRYNKIQDEDTSKYNLSQRLDRKERQKSVLDDIKSTKAIFNEQYEDTDNIWTDNYIQELEDGIAKSIKGLNDKKENIKKSNKAFVDGATKQFDKFVERYNSATKDKEKNEILEEMTNVSNAFNNKIIPIANATNEDIKDGRVAAQKSIDEIVSKFEKFVDEKRAELEKSQNDSSKNTKNDKAVKPVSSSSKKSKPLSENQPSTKTSRQLAEETAVYIQTRKDKTATQNQTNKSEENTNQNLDNLTVKVTKLEITEEAKTQLQTELSKIATIYISDVKLNEDNSLLEIRNNIETLLNKEPIKVDVLANIAGGITPSTNTEEAVDNQTKIKLEIGELKLSNPEIVNSIKKIIEDNLSPIFISSLDGTNTDTTSLKNKIETSLQNITIDKIEIDSTLTVNTLKDNIIQALKTIEMPVMDTSNSFAAFKTELETVIGGIKAPDIKPKGQVTKNEAKQFEVLIQTIDKVTKAVEKKTNAFLEEADYVELSANQEVEAIQKIIDRVNLLKNTLGTLKKIQVVFEKDAEDSKKPKKKSGKKKEETVSADVNEETKDTQENIDKENKKSANNEKKKAELKKEQNELLEEEYKLIKKINEEESKKDNKDENKISELKTLLTQNRNSYQALNLDKNDKTREDFFKAQYKNTLEELEAEQEKTIKDKKKFGKNEAKKLNDEVSAEISKFKNIDSTNLDRYADVIGECAVKTEDLIKKNKQLRAEAGNATALSSIDNQYSKLALSMTKWADANGLALKNKTALEEFNRILDKVENSANHTAEEINNLNAEFSRFQDQMIKKGNMGSTFFQQLGKSFESLGVKTIVNMGINYLEEYARQMLSNVREIDTAMTQLKKVTDETSKTYNEFLDEAGKRAEALGSTMSDFVTSTADFAKLGYNVNEASKLAENAIMYSNVGDLDIETATNDLVSVTKAFGFTADEVSRIVDSFNEVGNNYAVSAAQLGEGLRNSASSLVMAGTSMDESIAMLTAMTEITQDAASAGSALKILSLRIRGILNLPPYKEIYMQCV